MQFAAKNKETTSFKKRHTWGFKKNNLIFGDFSITLCKSYNLEYIYLFNYKRSLKKYFSFKKGPKKIWLFLHKNYPLTKKSKNSRMGKGKGALARFCSRVFQNHNIFEFIGFNIKEVIFLKKIFKKKVNIPVKILGNFFLNKQYRYLNQIENFFYFKRYNK